MSCFLILRRIACILLLTLLRGDVSTSQQLVKYVLTGKTGNGKTYLCNRYDSGNTCGAEGEGINSQTMQSYIGKEFVDTVGFGHNQVHDTENGLTGTLLALYRTLKAIDGLEIGAVVWVFNCLSLKPTHQDFDEVKLMFQAMGRVPLVVLLNPMGNSKCLMDSSKFAKLAADYDVHVNDVVDMSAFSTSWLKQNYAKSHLVAIPPNLETFLKKRDVAYLSEQIESYRNKRCDQLPAKLKEVESSMITHKKMAEKHAADLMAVTEAVCHAMSPPAMANCESKYCAKRGPRRYLGVVGPRDCVRYAIQTDDGCIRSNALKESGFKDKRADCVKGINNKKNTLKKLQQDHIKDTQDATEQRDKLVAVQRTCDTFIEVDNKKAEL